MCFHRYSKAQKKYKYYCPNLNKFVILADVSFFESKPYFENDLSVVEWVDDDLVYSLLRPLSSLVSHVQDKRTWNNYHPLRINSYMCINAKIHSVFRTRHLCQFPLLYQFLLVNMVSIFLYLRRLLPFLILLQLFELMMRYNLIQSCTSHPLYNFLFYANLSPPFHSFVSSVDSHPILKSLLEAMLHSGWWEAMKGEMRTLEQRNLGFGDSSKWKESNWSSLG